MAVSPGHEEQGYFHMPCGQSGHPLSPHYADAPRGLGPGRTYAVSAGAGDPRARALPREPKSMSDKLTTVFADERRELVYMVRTRLVEAGIEAFVVNDAMQIAVGEIPPGWTAAARVVVGEQDAAAADAIVRQFEDEALTPNSPTDAPDDDRAAASEPVGDVLLEPAQCPACGRSRMAVCPVCQTARADFPPADPAPDSDRAAGSPHEQMLVCTICDEPFVPGYLARCEWCGHDFGTGIRPVDPVTREPMDARVVAAVLGLSLAGLAIVAYFAVLLSR